MNDGKMILNALPKRLSGREAALQAAATVVSLFGVLLFLSMNFKSHAGLVLAGLLHVPVVFVLGWLVYAAPKDFRLGPLAAVSAGGAIACGWLWGLTDIFYWDGILTAGRANLVLLGRWGELTRFSLVYPVLAFLFHVFGNANWIGHLFVMTLGGVVLFTVTRTQRLSAQRWLVLLMAFAIPHLFVLSKWLYLDIPVIALITGAVVTFWWASRDGVWWKYALAALVLVLATTAKEIGFTAAVPMLLLAVSMPRGRRGRTLIFAILCVLVAAVASGILVYIYRQHNAPGQGQVDWLLLARPDLGERITSEWFLWAVWQHSMVMLWTGFGVFALLALVRPRGFIGRVVVAAVLLCGLAILLTIRDFRPDVWWHFHPIEVRHAEYKALVFYLMLLLLLGGGLIARVLRFRRPRPLEVMCWSMLVTIVFIFSAMGKAYFNHRIHWMWITIDWRYLGVAVPFLAILATRGAGALLARAQPVWMRVLAAVVLAMAADTAMMRSTALAAYFQEKARLSDAASQFVLHQDVRTVYTHWPFTMDFSRNFDYGSMQWTTRQIDLRSIEQLRAWQEDPKARPPVQPSLIMHVYTRSVASFPSPSLYPDILWSGEARIGILEPLAITPEWKTIEKAIVARVDLERRPPVPVTPNPDL